jgi:23S rRNA (cytosine1962-C5)-methyltransferase
MGAPGLPRAAWRSADLDFARGIGWRGTAPFGWRLQSGPVVLGLKPAGEGHLGFFPEQLEIARRLAAGPPVPAGGRILNLFAHTGLITLRLASLPGGAEILHVDAAPGMVGRARENARLSRLERAPIRWLVDDALIFLAREARRRPGYDLLVADPPAYGKCKKGGDWKLERDLPELVGLAGRLLLPRGGRLCLTCHRPGWDGNRLASLAAAAGTGKIETFPLTLETPDKTRSLTAGTALFAVFSPGGR